jgi:outer membrane protein OmpA-like peptidoglycan-associated protein
MRFPPRPHPILAALAAITLSPVSAQAIEPGFAVHAEGAAARMVGDGKDEQFGWGGGGLVSPELTLNRFVGLEVAIGALGLSDGSMDDPGLEPTAAGYSVFALPGLRLRPFGRNGHDGAFQPGGIWISGGGGLAFTGGAARGAVDARIGYDLFANKSFRGGPSLGYLQIIETESAVRPDDARIVLFGVHAAYEPNDAPLVDNDRDDDGIPNAADRCPDDPEDFDKFQDDDGCPELDNDRDGIIDVLDRCPEDPEDRDGWRDKDGCPDPDNDDDGLLDREDACPDEAEDIDGFEDEDGCPDDDNDNDGIPDIDDKCPLDPETVNGYADDDGCPDEELVRVVGNEILLDDRVHFRINSDIIEMRSWPLMESVAKLLKANPQYSLVHVQGHADDTGPENYNQKLSERRSVAVRNMLVRFGVSPERLVTEAFGESRPRDADTTIYAREKNRRVEFLILERRRELKRLVPAAEILEGALP